jgi:hypothetical protein
MTNGRGGLFRKIVLGLGVIAVGGVAMSAAPAMAHDFDRHDRVEVRRDRVIVERDHRRWVPARYEFRTRVDCGRTVTERVLVEPGCFIDG